MGDQSVAAGGHHHRIEHHMGDVVAAQGLRHHVHGLGRGKHANLHGIHANVLHHGIDLCAQHLRRHGVNGAYPLGVLCRHGRDGGHAIAAQGAEGFQISLNACTAATVGACNREHAHIARHGTAWRGLKGRGRRFSAARGGACGTRQGSGQAARGREGHGQIMAKAWAAPGQTLGHGPCVVIARYERNRGAPAGSGG